MGAIGIIPARSGSKGLKDKNIKELCGKPMIAYTIEACIRSGCFDVVHVSTDSEEYAEIARRYGADVPFLRPKELAADQATTEETVRFVLAEYEKRGLPPFFTFAIMQPTSPLRSWEDIQAAFSLMKEKNADSVIGVCEMEHSPLWSNVLPEDRSMEGFLDRAQNRDRHQLSQYYRINGAMYLVKTDSYTQHTAMYGPKSYGYLMPKARSVDVDDEMDFIIAQALLNNKKAKKSR